MVVYLVTNQTNGKQYVGQTIQPLEDRWSKHKSTSNCVALGTAIQKYGSENFTIEILHVCKSKEEMDFVEIFYITFLNTKSHNGYNIADGGEGGAVGNRSKLGQKDSEETRKKKSKPKSIITRNKIRIALKGIPRPWASKRMKTHPNLPQLPKKIALCHPQRAHYALSMCSACYQQARKTQN